MIDVTSVSIIQPETISQEFLPQIKMPRGCFTTVYATDKGLNRVWQVLGAQYVYLEFSSLLSLNSLLQVAHKDCYQGKQLIKMAQKTTDSKKTLTTDLAL